jgi:phosphatidylglycerophosphate synthase
MNKNFFNLFTQKITEKEIFLRDDFWRGRIPKNHPSPNFLTAIRILGSLFIILVTLNTIPFLVVLVLLFLTDYFDGVIARTRNEQTLLGKWLDPVADKLLLISVIYFLYHSNPNFWEILLPIIIGQELLILLLGLFLSIKKKSITPVQNLWGRLKFTLYCFGTIFFLLKLYFISKLLIFSAILVWIFCYYISLLKILSEQKQLGRLVVLSQFLFQFQYACEGF